MEYEYDGEGLNGASITDGLIMVVEDVFSIAGRGTVLTGKILSGPVFINDKIQIVSPNGTVIDTKINAIEAFRKSLDTAEAGENVGLLVRGVDRSDVEPGDSVRRRD